MASHSPLKICVIVATVLMYIVMVALNGLGGTDGGAGIFTNRTGTIANVFYLEVTPAGWTFSIWGFIYAWQAIWLIYALVTIFRKKAGTYLYLMPMYPTVIFVTYILNNLANVGWLLAWDRAKVAIALPLIALTPLTLYICLFFSFKRLYDNLDFMMKNGLNTDIWLIRMLIQNGLSFYAAWVTVATLINVAIVMTYKDGSDITDIAIAQDVSSTVILLILLVVIMVWFTLDLTVFDKYTRYTFSPYITWTIGMAGVISKNYNLDTVYRNSVIMVVLQVLAAFCLLGKVLVMIWRHFKRPIEPMPSEYKPTF